MPSLSLGLSLRGQMLTGKSFSPTSLFLGGEKGFIYDVSNRDTLFTDTSGTTKVSAAGQAVARVNDFSPNSANLTQATGASMPLYQVDGSGRPYLSFDGSNDWLQSGTLDYSAVSTFSLIIGLYKASDAAVAFPVEFGTSTTTVPGFAIRVPHGAATTVSAVHRGATFTVFSTVVDVGAAPKSLVLSMTSNMTTPKLTFRTNGTSAADANSNPGGGAYGSAALYVGRRNGASNPFSGRIFGIIGVARILTAQEILMCETWMNSRTGAF